MRVELMAITCTNDAYAAHMRMLQNRIAGSDLDMSDLDCPPFDLSVALAFEFWHTIAEPIQKALMASDRVL